ncbi:reverse transcriptase domain-containing protein [Tanacetum coccineum]
MSAPDPKRFSWEIVYPPPGLKMYIDPVTGLGIKRTANRCRVPVPTHLLQVKEKSPEKIHDVDLEEDPKEEEEPKEAFESVTINVNNVNGNGGNENGGNGNRGNNNGCTYKEFLACKPRDYDGKGGAILLTRWIEKMKSVMDISGCVNNQKVRYAVSSLINKALTWWNTQIQATGHEAALGMTWEEFKALIMEEFCPSNEMDKLESEFWNHVMVGANHAVYTDKCHELAKLVPHLVTPESKHIDRYIHGLVLQIHGMIQATQPAIIQSVILKAGTLTDKAIRNEYAGSYPKCAKCNAHHPEGRACQLCYNCQKPGHFARDCRSASRQVTPINAVRMGNGQRACYECRSRDHFCNTCPKLNRALGQVGNRLKIEGNQNPRNNRNQARGTRFSMNTIEARPDPNVVTVPTAGKENAAELTLSEQI